MPEFFVEVQDVVPGCLTGTFQHGLIDLEQDTLNLVYRQQGIVPAQDISGQSANADDIVRHVRLELGVSGEHDHGKELVLSDLEQGFKFLDVFVVLPERVLEGIFALAEGLRPLGMVRVSEDPSAHILSFDDEDAIFRNDDVVDLRGAVCRGEGDVVELAVPFRVELVGEGLSDTEFAKPSFEGF